MSLEFFFEPEIDIGMNTKTISVMLPSAIQNHVFGQSRAKNIPFFVPIFARLDTEELAKEQFAGTNSDPIAFPLLLSVCIYGSIHSNLEHCQS